jgi:hypothetical protein
VLAYKFLQDGAVGPFSGFSWPEPAANEPGEWVSVVEPVAPCGPGIHACRTRDLPYWLNDELWEVELGGTVVEERRGLVAERGRLLRRLDRWPAAAVELARVCSLIARDTAVAILAAEGFSDETDTLAGATHVDVLRAGFESIGRSASGEHVSRTAAYAADIAAYASRGINGDAAWTSCTAYTTALLSGYAAAGDVTLARGHPAYAAERDRQADWLAERLGLPSESTA